LLLSVDLQRSLLDVWPAFTSAWPIFAGLAFATALAILWWLYRKPYVELERQSRNSELAAIKNTNNVELATEGAEERRA
jgi:hypothetical protein